MHSRRENHCLYAQPPSKHLLSLVPQLVVPSQNKHKSQVTKKLELKTGSDSDGLLSSITEKHLSCHQKMLHLIPNSAAIHAQLFTEQQVS